MLLGLAAADGAAARSCSAGRTPSSTRPALRVGAALEASDFHPGRSGRNHLLTLSRAAGLPRLAAWTTRCRLVELTSAARPPRQELLARACASGSPWPPRCSATPSCSSSTSPRTGSTPRASAGCATSCATSRPAGRTVFVSSHVLAEVAQTVDRVLIVNRGKLVIESPLGRADRAASAERCAFAARRPRALAGGARARAGIAVDAGDGCAARDGQRRPSRRRRDRRRAPRSSSHELVARELVARGDLPRADVGGRSGVIDQTRAELLEDPLDAHDARARARDGRARAALVILTGLLERHE